MWTFLSAVGAVPTVVDVPALKHQEPFAAVDVDVELYNLFPFDGEESVLAFESGCEDIGNEQCGFVDGNGFGAGVLTVLV